MSLKMKPTLLSSESDSASISSLDEKRVNRGRTISRVSVSSRTRNVSRMLEARSNHEATMKRLEARMGKGQTTPSKRATISKLATSRVPLETDLGLKHFDYGWKTKKKHKKNVKLHASSQLSLSDTLGSFSVSNTGDLDLNSWELDPLNFDHGSKNSAKNLKTIPTTVLLPSTSILKVPTVIAGSPDGITTSTETHNS